MSTTELLTKYYDAFNRGDASGMLALLSDSVVHDINQGDREIGKEAFAKFLNNMNEYYQERLENITIMVAPGEARAAAEFTCHGLYKKSAPDLPPARGQRYVLPVGAFFEITNGKIARITNYYNLADWLRQVT